jgi:hypothetical protein
MADAGTILTFWQAAQGPGAGRAQRLLEAAGEADGAGLTLGEAARRLIALRGGLVGRAVDAVARCPACGALNEARFVPADMVGAAGGGPVTVEAEGWRATARPLTLADMEAASASGDADAAADLLRARAITALESPVEGGVPPVALVAAVEAALDAADPLADARIALVCAECSRPWEVAFDPALLLAAELDAAARRAMAEVATLARAYGWSEADILAMPAARRQIYLDLAG